MAGFATHILFGQDVLEEMEDRLFSSMAKKHRKVFAIGCQGPDLFLYNGAMLLSAYQKNLGSRMHGEGSGRYFACLLQEIWELGEAEAFQIGVSYFFGLLAHYTLDTQIHPYVNAKIGFEPDVEYSGKETMPKHHRLEAAIDAKMLAVKKGILPSCYKPSEDLSITGEERRVLSGLISRSVSRAYHIRLREDTVSASIRMMRLIADSFFYHPDRRIRFYKKVEKPFIKGGFYSNLLIADSYLTEKDIMNTQKKCLRNPWDKSRESDDSVWELYDAALSRYANYMEQLQPLLGRYRSHWMAMRQPYYSTAACQENICRRKGGQEGTSIRKEIASAVKCLENLSYNTGLPL